MMGFFARFLGGEIRGHRRQLIERIGDEAFVKGAVEELLRRHGIAHRPAQGERANVSWKGIDFRGPATMILPPGRRFVGLDERQKNPAPARRRLRAAAHDHDAVRPPAAMACPGAVLARRELQIFLEEMAAAHPRLPDQARHAARIPDLDGPTRSPGLELVLAVAFRVHGGLARPKTIGGVCCALCGKSAER